MRWFAEKRSSSLADPLDSPGLPLRRLTKREKQLLEKLAAGRKVGALVRTGTTVDVGEWFRRGRVYGMCLPGEWVMFAPGKQPFIEKVSIQLLAASLYNHIVGELVLAPAPGVRLRQLRMAPLDAGRLLRQFSKAIEEEVKKEIEHA